MPYRAPNSYARFVKSAGPVNNPGSTRIMGLVGTGLNNFKRKNDLIVRSDNKVYDKLDYENVSAITSVSNKPIKDGTKDNSIINYTEGVSKTITETIDDNTTIQMDVTTDGSVTFNDEWPDNIIDLTIDTYEEDNDYVVDYDNKTIIIQKDNEDNFLIPEGNYDVVFNYQYEQQIETDPIKPYSLKEGKYIVWDNAIIEDAEVKDLIFGTESQIFSDEISVIINDTKSYLVEDGEYKIEVSYISDDPESAYDGSIIVTDRLTELVIGEYPVKGGENMDNIIPGLNILINSLDIEGIEIGNSINFTVKSAVVDEDIAPTKGAGYYVSYRYDKPESGYEPKIFYDYDDIVAEYGDYDVSATGEVTNSLALGAEIAFQNGLGPIVCVQARTDSAYYMKKAIDKLKRGIPGVDNVNTIIPLVDEYDPDIASHIIGHVELMSSSDEGKERMVYLGSPRFKRDENDDIIGEYSVEDFVPEVRTIADEFDNERVVFVVPSGATKEVRDTETGIINERTIPSSFVAVAVAALGLRNDPAEPLTNKYITGFNKVDKIFTESEMNSLAEVGCLVLQQVGSRIKVRHGITTSTADINSNEITLIQIKDYVIDACRKITAETYIGNKNRPSIVTDVTYTITSILNQFISQEVILGFQNLKVERNKDNPTQIDVRFEIEAVYPLNYINITFGFAATS